VGGGVGETRRLFRLVRPFRPIKLRDQQLKDLECLAQYSIIPF